MFHTWIEICFRCKRPTEETDIILCSLAREPEHKMHMEHSEAVGPAVLIEQPTQSALTKHRTLLKLIHIKLNLFSPGSNAYWGKYVQDQYARTALTNKLFTSNPSFK
ncbi:977235b9-5bca-4fb3-9720-dc9493f2b884 [Sclerotinia trifoliorum]|uniref:977235b9-5bca-4fb3-9720-dc9493f2b884 n=1 Tax=Sclerotinia trifoliorum TaxID=28548 RepID=A0A8H2ZLA7_9HELO|nr:977235b9-5bca-4fb3-9720-dc9493f2b884 [Sclerotinia trifoliorum]